MIRAEKSDEEPIVKIDMLKTFLFRPINNYLQKTYWLWKYLDRNRFGKIKTNFKDLIGQI